MDKTLKELQILTDELFSLMGVKIGSTVAFDKTNEAFTINIDAGEETGLLIGRKGETLSSIQMVLGIMLKQKTGEWARVLVNVGDYREKEEDYLKNLAEGSATRAKETGEPQMLYNLKPGQRRIIHMFLSEDKTVETESVGEGSERYLLVKPKKA
ncbi:MAG: R3H domain-containing nucleic acid-binding protein [Patescibacteria group bacterium]